MIKLFTPRCWWPSLKRDIKDWIKTCPSCQVNSRISHIHHDVMHPSKIPTAFDRWHLNFMGEMSKTVKGNRGLLIGVDYVTNWPVARAVPFATKEVITNFIYEELMMRFGCSSEILTDRGANFNNGLVNAYLKRVGTYHKLTSAYHPRTS
ncbi:hypothetical protein A0J61_10227 [Choanephora cucurbitarum]|uniref:Integrase catalytic domain-containing protein n=1 Tax=Choanephora cucurbitarum TaxID=101091 RepID=A0A1C7MY31_9FUNG|nr:hypothetical protein A0J61_10227 [Choanephora cucurbitarum]